MAWRFNVCNPCCAPTDTPCGAFYAYMNALQSVQVQMTGWLNRFGQCFNCAALNATYTATRNNPLNQLKFTVVAHLNSPESQACQNLWGPNATAPDSFTVSGVCLPPSPIPSAPNVTFSVNEVQFLNINYSGSFKIADLSRPSGTYLLTQGQGPLFAGDVGDCGVYGDGTATNPLILTIP